MNKNEELQKWLNDDRYVQGKELAEMWGINISSVGAFLSRNNIKATRILYTGKSVIFAFYDRHKCENARLRLQQKIKGVEDCKSNKMLVSSRELAQLWSIRIDATRSFLCKHGIKPFKYFHTGVGSEHRAFYDRAECERARPFINQPEQKEVEKVEEVNLLESELDSEELASENGSALNDAELAAIITACKDPVDKIMILSALCFGVKSGELSSLNLRDISGADICLQSPSGVVKMRIPKQYEDARTELLTYYVDNGNNLSGDMPVFLNRSGIRMTRQGLNNRMKSVSESANIGRDVKLSDLRATFAQNIYKKTEKNIASVHKYLRLSENTNIMGYLLETQSKEQKTMPVDLMNSLTASYQAKEPPTIAEPKEQTPDIIPADTIDLFTMSELETELKNRDVELTAEVRAKINASDMPEMQHIAKMLRGNANTITIRLSVLNEIAGQLREVELVPRIIKNMTLIEFEDKNGKPGDFYIDRELKPCPFCGDDRISVFCEELQNDYWLAKIECSGCDCKNEHDDDTKEESAKILIDYWNKRSCAVEDSNCNELKKRIEKLECIIANTIKTLQTA